MEEICGLIPSSTDDNSKDNNYYHLDHPLMMKNGEEDHQYYYHEANFVMRSSPWLPTSPCASVLSAAAATDNDDDDNNDNDDEPVNTCNSVEKSGSMFSLQLEADESSSSNGDILRAKISSHPLYPRLLEAYINFQKVGAPPEMASLFDEIVQENARKATVSSSYSCLGEDPELDEFMETYCRVLAKWKLDLEKPYQEATTFLSNMESQLTNLCNKEATAIITLGDEDGGVCCNDDTSSGETEEQQCRGRSEANDEIKEKLLRKYGGYMISSLRHEYFSKKKINSKLPSDATHILQNWWTIHNHWPYPTEADKIALAETTGLDQKQINNWFINQRKRHWKPSDHHPDLKPYLLNNVSGLFYPQ